MPNLVRQISSLQEGQVVQFFLLTEKMTLFTPIIIIAIIIANLTQPNWTGKQYLENEIQPCSFYNSAVWILTWTQLDKKVVKMVFFYLHTLHRLKMDFPKMLFVQ